MPLETGLSRNNILLALGAVVAIGVLGSVFSHDNTVQILGFCSFVIVSLFSLLQQIRTAENLIITATKVEAVKQALIEEGESTAKKVQEVKTTLIATGTKTAEKLEVASEKVLEVKTALIEVGVHTHQQLIEIAKTSESMHSLVNSAMGVQLKLNTELSRWKANQTKLPEDATTANLAEKLYHEHEAKQANVDAQTKTPMLVTIVPAAAPLPVTLEKPKGAT